MLLLILFFFFDNGNYLFLSGHTSKNMYLRTSVFNTSSIDRSVAEQPGIFSRPWVLGAKAAQCMCVNISTRSQGHVEFTTFE